MIVFDAGVWLSAIRFGGTPRQAIEKAVMVDQIATSSYIEEEIVRGLVRKFDYSQADAEEIVFNSLERALHVAITGQVSGICRDSKDDHILECALKAEATLIVSGEGLACFGCVSWRSNSHCPTVS